MNVKLVGLEHVLEVLGPDLIAKPMGDFFKRVGVTVQSKVRPLVPSDVGQARNEIQFEVDKDTPPMSARVGWLGAPVGTSKWFKARAIEYGTARQGDPEVSHKSSHFPPPAALDRWARRHGGGTGYEVASSIAARGGLVPKRPLRRGLRDSLGDVKSLIVRLGQEIADQW